MRGEQVPELRGAGAQVAADDPGQVRLAGEPVLGGQRPQGPIWHLADE